MSDLTSSLNQYKDQIVNHSLETSTDANERKSLLELQSELQQLITLTQESFEVQRQTNDQNVSNTNTRSNSANDELDDEYALFMKEMAQSGAYGDEKTEKETEQSMGDCKSEDIEDIEDELASLLGMKCAVYHTFSWGGKGLHNAMVSSVVPHQEDDQFNDLQVQVLFTHPTHPEMLPCPFFLNGECKFDDEQCRYSHGSLVRLSDLKEAIEPKFEMLKVGSKILLKLKPPDNEDITIAKKSTEKYHLWHKAIVTSIDPEEKMCVAKLEQAIKTGEKRKTVQEEYHVHFEEIFPLIGDSNDSSDSDDSISDTEYPAIKIPKPDQERTLLVEKTLEKNIPALGEWERHTRGIGSKLMLAMGYVAGAGLGARGAGRVQPVEARVLPPRAALDRCLELSAAAAAAAAAGKDPLKVEQRLKRLKKREEERHKRAYEREKEREKRNVFNFLNRTLGENSKAPDATPATSIDIKQSSSKDLNIEQFKVEEDTRRLESEIIKLKNNLCKYPSGTSGHRNVGLQIAEKNKELAALKQRGLQITREQKHRKDRQKMTVF